MEGKQTKKNSFIEANTSTAIGFVITLFAWKFVLFPTIIWVEATYGITQSAWSVSIGITIFFTIISITRGYYVRRWFDRKG